MYLKALEIQGFKSFPDKTVLTFGEDITAIVGPNGSGKSNISDAIRWVMGEQSTRALRGGKMEDVIFGGTAQRRQTGYAEVSLILDNTSHIFPMDESEVMVTRRYYRSGESEYYINRRSVRLKDVNELFMDTGLGREGYSIIGQGKIDEILSVKSADRREVFEEAAGISRYRHRKEEAERKLVHTDENLVRVNDKIAELELQVEPLREQSERARKFLVLRDELKGLEVSVWLDTLERLRASHIKLDADYQEAARQKEEARAALERLYAAAEALSAQMREKDVEADRLRFESQSREAAAAELESAIAVLKNNVQNNLDNAQRIRADLDQQEGRADSLAGQIGQRQERLAEIEDKLTRMREELRGKSEQARRRPGLPGHWHGSWRNCGRRRPWRRPPPPRPRPCSPPWRLPLRRCWTGTRRCARSCGSWTAGWRRGAPPSVRPGRPWPRRWRSGTRCRTSSAATPCAWSHAGKRRSRPGSAI